MSTILKGIDIPKDIDELRLIINGMSIAIEPTEAIQIDRPHGRIIDEKELKDLYSQMPFNDNEIRFSKNDIYCNLWNNKTILEAEE